MNADEMMTRARNALLLNDYTSALEYAEKIRDQYPGSPQIHLFIGNIYSRQRKHNKAIRAYQNVIELDPENPEAHNNIGVIYRYTGNIPAAIGAIEHALRLVPGRADILYNLGNIYKQIEDYPRAIDYYTQALEADPGYVLACNNWGTTLQSRGMEKEAETVFRQGLAVDPNNSTLSYNLGICLQNQNRDDEAVTEFTRALRSAPTWEDGLNNLGVSLERIGQKEKAYSVYNRALEKNPGSVKLRNNMAVVLGALGREDEAAEILEETIRQNPGYTRAAVNLEAIQERKGSFKDAYANLKKLLSADRNNPELRIRFASVCLELRKINQAKESITWLVNRYPDDSRGFFLLARFQELTGKRNEAVLSCQKSLKNDPDNSETRLRLAILFKELRHYQKAIAQASHILALNPRNYEARLLLGKLYLLENLYEEALNILEELQAEHPADEELLNALLRGYKGAGNKEKAVGITEELINLHNAGDDLDLDELSRNLSMYEETMEAYAAEHEALWEENLKKLTAVSYAETEKGGAREGESILFERIPDLDRPAPIIDIGGIEPVIAINEDEETVNLAQMEEELEDFQIEEAKERERLLSAGSDGNPGQAGKGGTGPEGSGQGGHGNAQSGQMPYSTNAAGLPFNFQLLPSGSNFQIQLPGSSSRRVTIAARSSSRTEGGKKPNGAKTSAAEQEKLQAGDVDEDIYEDEADDPGFHEETKEDINALSGEDSSVRMLDYLKGLIEYLPDEKKKEAGVGEVKLKMEAIKERLKGRGGLFKVLSEEREKDMVQHVIQDRPVSENEGKPLKLSKESISDTLSFIQDLSVYHPNREIGVALHHKIADIVRTIRKKNGSA